MVQSIEVLACDGLLTQKDAALVVVRLQLCWFVHQSMIDLVVVEGLAFLVVDHEVEERELIGDRVGEIDCDKVGLLGYVDY